MRSMIWLAVIEHTQVNASRREKRCRMIRLNRQTIARSLQRAFIWGETHLPFGVRTVLGILFSIGGLFGFLPILGFWMLPIGVVLIALDVPPLRRRLATWIDHHARTDVDDA